MTTTEHPTEDAIEHPIDEVRRWLREQMGPEWRERVDYAQERAEARWRAQDRERMRRELRVIDGGQAPRRRARPRRRGGAS
jgi:hypothetical protein